MWRIVLIAAVCVGAGCRARPDDVVLRYLQLAAALGERDPDAIDYYYGPLEWVSNARAQPPSAAEIKRSALELLTRVRAENPPHKDFLLKQLQAIATRADLLTGAKPIFEAEARELFDLELPPEKALEKHLDETRLEIGRLLPGPGSPAQRYAGFDGQFIIPAERLTAVMNRAMEECRERTLQRVTLPAGEAVSVEYVGNKPWNAYSFYEGKFHSRIQINTDFALTVDRALQLACHEGYPGHHVYNTLTDAQLVQREHRVELMVQPTFSPQSCSSVALATYAADVAFPQADRLRFERDVLFPLARLDAGKAEEYILVSRLVNELESAEPAIARDYLDGRLEWVRAASALEERAFMTHTEATLKYLNEYRTYMLTYAVGKDMVKTCFANRPADDRWALFEQLITGRVLLRDCGLTNPKE